MVFDNILHNGTNIMYGTRAKAWAEFYNRFDQKKINTTILGIDARHYLKIHRTFIAAFRVAASTSFGPGKLMYYMGGVDGWLIPQYDKSNNIDQSQSYLFQTLTNGVRGFRQNVRNGNTFFLASAELRFPIVRYLLNYNVRSEVLNNLQLVGFADMGSAYVGLNPYSEINTYVTNTVQQGPLLVTVKTQREPIIGGLGWGVRTKLLGYFLRVDLANGIENGKLNKARLYVSFGTDF
jgi:outer membrane protein assembly factor BamA